MKSFKDVPVESDTVIKEEKELIIAGMNALYQYWRWDSIIAESIIFHSKDVQHFTDEEVFKIIKQYYADFDSSAPIGKCIIKRTNSGFTFINFNFMTDS